MSVLRLGLFTGQVKPSWFWTQPQTHLPASSAGQRNPKSTTRISQLSISGKGEHRLVWSIVGIFFFFLKRSSKFAKNVIEIWKKSPESRKICRNLEKGARIYIFFLVGICIFSLKITGIWPDLAKSHQI